MNQQDRIDEIEHNRDKAKRLGYETMIKNYKKLSFKRADDIRKVD